MPQIVLVAKQEAHSNVWNLFGFEAEDHQRGVIVYKRYLSIVAAPRGNITNIENHLKRRHKIDYEMAVKGKPLLSAKITDFFCILFNWSAIKVFVGNIRIAILILERKIMIEILT